MIYRGVTCGCPPAEEEAMGFMKCPTCGSYDTVRHTEMYRVWFTCNRCGSVFK